jgi:hypothetical protein
MRVDPEKVDRQPWVAQGGSPKAYGYPAPRGPEAKAGTNGHGHRLNGRPRREA